MKKTAIVQAKKLISLQSSMGLNGVPFLLEPEIYESAEIAGLGGKTPEEVITQMLIEQIESGEDLQWKKSWASGGNVLAQNFISKKPYTGGNSILLNVIYGPTAPTPYYLTFNQIKEKGGTLKKGSKGYPITFYSFSYKIKSEETIPGILNKVEGRVLKRKKGGNLTITRDNYTRIYITEAEVKILDLESKELYSIPNLRYFKVYNIADTEGIPYELPTGAQRSEHEIIAMAEAIVNGYSDIPKIEKHPENASYNPKEDKLKMPDPKQFENSEEYYSTLFHEMIHSTGHKSRLDRLDNYKGKDQNASYAFEELVAELGASYLCGHAGIFHVVRANQAAYIKDWKEKLIAFAKSDANFILEAAKQSQKAVEYIMRDFTPPTEDDSGSEGEEEEKARIKAKQKAKIRAMAKLKIAKAKLKLNN